MDIKADEISKIIREQIGSFAVDRDSIKPGDEISAFGVKGDDGVARATRVQVSKK